MRKTSCDYCGKIFSARDEYMSAALLLRSMDGDDLSEANIDLCEECLIKVKAALTKLRTRK